MEGVCVEERRAAGAEEEMKAIVAKALDECRQGSQKRLGLLQVLRPHALVA